MEEIKFISARKIPTEHTRNVVKQILIEMSNEPKYDCEIVMLDKPIGEFAGLYNDFSVFEKETKERLLWGEVQCLSFLDEWGVSAKQNPKALIGNNPYYIMLIRETGEYLKRDDKGIFDGILFVFDFIIRFLELIPDTFMETLTSDKKTMFKDYNLKQVLEMREAFIKGEDIESYFY